MRFRMQDFGVFFWNKQINQDYIKPLFPSWPLTLDIDKVVASTQLPPIGHHQLLGLFSVKPEGRCDIVKYWCLPATACHVRSALKANFTSFAVLMLNLSAWHTSDWLTSHFHSEAIKFWPNKVTALLGGNDQSENDAAIMGAEEINQYLVLFT